VKREPGDLTHWWTVFNDSVLDGLVERAYSQNPTLQAAAVRVLEAQAAGNVAFAALFPQSQAAAGAYSVNRISTNEANVPAGIDQNFQDWRLGFGAAWELDFWGRFRRAVEAADADVLAAIASYDDVLVSLIANVAGNYIVLRTLEERLVVARANVEIQSRALEIARARFEGGTVTELDASQAASLLGDTQSIIPGLEASRRQAENALCILLGIPPRDLRDILGAEGLVPPPPDSVAVGIPADLLRRRPDVRRTERQLASQCARIGVAKSELYPAISLAGDLGVVAEDAGDLFKGDSIAGFAGPSFRWPLLNYGRITNTIRAEDARFQALVSEYEAIVLRAQGEVEDAIAGFIGAKRQAVFLTQSVQSATRAQEIAELQYRGGTADYTRVLDTQTFLAVEQDKLVVTRGLAALRLVDLYRALGGGWEVREGMDPISEETRQMMRERTAWGSMLDGGQEAEGGGR
jgi:NodT family efflux transporter outer membrane factor (OMF) lipoprotein